MVLEFRMTTSKSLYTVFGDWEGQIGKLRPYVADIPINLWWMDLLQHLGTQYNIPAFPETTHGEIRGEMADAPGEGIDECVSVVQTHVTTGMEFPNL